MDRERELVDAVRDAAAPGTALELRGGGSKRFLGRSPSGRVLDLAGHEGILRYAPGELVITARAGTPLAGIEATLDEAGQMLAFEPPAFGAGATLGGTVAASLAGPRRPFAGAVRDSVLGVRLIDGRGRALGFGGEVVKNVAGYDLARLMCGAMGTLGVLLEVSLKVLPRPACETTLWWPSEAGAAIERMNAWAGRPLPLSAACHDGERLYLRLSGGASAVEAGARSLGGERLADGDTFWRDLREHRLPFFDGPGRLWRLAVPPATPPLALPGRCLLDWAGGQRWLVSDGEAAAVRSAAADVGGHATLFRGETGRDRAFQPPDAPLLALQRRVKQALDPAGILNPGRLYPDL